MAANAKKDIFTEKVLALTVEDCLRVKEAVERNGVKFVISFPWKFNPAYKALQYSCLENPRDRGAWWAAVYEVAQSRTRLK